MQIVVSYRLSNRLVFGAMALWGSLAGGVADSPKVVAQPGFHLVRIKSGGGVAYVQVKDTPKASTDGSGPAFNSTFDLANKSYAFADGKNSSAQSDLQRTFTTTSFFGDGQGDHKSSTPNLDTKVAVNSANIDEHASGFDRAFSTTKAEVGQDKSSDLAAKTSDFSGKSAAVGGHEERKFAYADASKTYAGPEAALVKRDLAAMNQGLLGIKDLPNRPLTIDEVRALINHGIKPDLDNKPAPASKPLNDPDYMPDPAPAPLRGESSRDADDGGVPAPGTIAHPELSAPENAEPLPR